MTTQFMRHTRTILIAFAHSSEKVQLSKTMLNFSTLRRYET
jgi:hypothetical protein